MHKLSYFIARKSLERIERKSHEFFNTENGKSYFALPPLAPAVLPRDLIIQINFSSLRPRQKIKPVKITANPRNIPSPQLLISFESFCAKLKRFPSDPKKRFSKHSPLGIPIKGFVDSPIHFWLLVESICRPGWQAHSNEPGRLLQICSQPCSPSHSLMSAEFAFNVQESWTTFTAHRDTADHLTRPG